MGKKLIFITIGGVLIVMTFSMLALVKRIGKKTNKDKTETEKEIKKAIADCANTDRYYREKANEELEKMLEGKSDQLRAIFGLNQ